jgi:hypothetical protein
MGIEGLELRVERGPYLYRLHTYLLYSGLVQLICKSQPRVKLRGDC